MRRAAKQVPAAKQARRILSIAMMLDGFSRDTTAAGLQQLVTSVATVRTDCESLARGSESTATVLEQSARSLKSTAANAAELTETTERLVSAVTETRAQT